ncbi:hypothetical protein GCM10020331_000370 [Ectobacillus funiculus]
MLEDIFRTGSKKGTLSVAEAKEQLATFENLGFAKVDHHRKNDKASRRLYLVKERLRNKSFRSVRLYNQKQPSIDHTNLKRKG